MEQLPRNEWRAQIIDSRHVAVAAHANNGYLNWTKVRLSDAANDCIGRNDLERVVVDEVHL